VGGRLALTGRLTALLARIPARAAAHGLFPDVVEVLAAGLGPAEAIVEGEVVAVDPSAGELRPFGEAVFRRRKHGIAEVVRDVPVGLFCFELLYADGQDLTVSRQSSLIRRQVGTARRPWRRDRSLLPCTESGRGPDTLGAPA